MDSGTKRLHNLCKYVLCINEKITFSRKSKIAKCIAFCRLEKNCALTALAFENSLALVGGHGPIQALGHSLSPPRPPIHKQHIWTFNIHAVSEVACRYSVLAVYQNSIIKSRMPLVLKAKRVKLKFIF